MRVHTNRFPRIFTVFPRNDNGSNGREKWPGACRIPIYRALTLQGAPRLNTFMLECVLSVRFIFLFFRGSMHALIPQLHACRTWIFSRLLCPSLGDRLHSALNTNPTNGPRTRYGAVRTCSQSEGSKNTKDPPRLYSRCERRAFPRSGTALSCYVTGCLTHVRWRDRSCKRSTKD